VIFTEARDFQTPGKISKNAPKTKNGILRISPGPQSVQNGPFHGAPQGSILKNIAKKQGT
jgi:hypothetical protein